MLGFKVEKEEFGNTNQVSHTHTPEIRGKKSFFGMRMNFFSFTWWFIGIYICINHVKLHGVDGKKKRFGSLF